MRRFSPNSLIAWLCLICFGAGSSLLRGEMVLCQHADGGSQIEWGYCATDDSGNCLTGCGDSAPSDSDLPKPCKDTPIKGDQQVAKIAVSRAPLPAWHPVPVLATLAWIPSVETCRTGASRPGPRGRPPDPLARLRSIVLLV